MDDPELIIYIIFLAVSLLGGVYKNFKKNQDRKNAPEPVMETTEMDDMEEMFERQRQEEEIARAFEEERRRIENKRLTEEKEALILKDETARSVSFARRESSRQKRTESASSGLEPVIEESISTQFDLEDFDVRKAIIYSEILNPPYL